MKKNKIVHKLEGDQSINIFSTVWCQATKGLASRFWKHITCKRCLKKGNR